MWRFKANQKAWSQTHMISCCRCQGWLGWSKHCVYRFMSYGPTCYLANCSQNPWCYYVLKCVKVQALFHLHLHQRGRRRHMKQIGEEICGTSCCRVNGKRSLIAPLTYAETPIALKDQNCMVSEVVCVWGHQIQSTTLYVMEMEYLDNRKVGHCPWHCQNSSLGFACWSYPL